MYKQTNAICKPKRILLFQLIINCTIIMKTKSLFSRNVYAISDRIWCNKHLRHTHGKNIIKMGKVDTSDLMMIITWAFDISFQSDDIFLFSNFFFNIKFVCRDIGLYYSGIILCMWYHISSQWDTPLHSNIVSHWLGSYTKWFLTIDPIASNKTHAWCT